ncbi:hypothetical protein ALC56_03566, partial [Trachymyrmex septentrionalis]
LTGIVELGSQTDGSDWVASCEAVSGMSCTRLCHSGSARPGFCLQLARGTILQCLYGVLYSVYVVSIFPRTPLYPALCASSCSLWENCRK